MNGKKSSTIHLNCLMVITLWLSIISDVNCAFNCTGLGVFAKPQSSCRSYIVCYQQNNQKFVAEERNCAADQVFNEYELKCVPSQSYNCIEEPCLNRVGRFIKPNTDCQDYYLCSKVNNGFVSNTYSCQDGSRFSSLTSRCEAGYRCTEIQPRQSVQPTTPRPAGTGIQPVTQIIGVQSTTQRPIGVQPTTARPTTIPVVNISTPASNLIALVNVKSVSTLRPSVAPVQPTTARPTTRQVVEISSPASNLVALITVRNPTTPRPPTPSCSTNCIMTTKTGLYPHSTDPCSYVSCTRTADILYCANMKCDPGLGFVQQSGRCIASNLCTPKPKSNM